MVPSVGQEQVAVGKDGEAVHAVELRRNARSVVASKTFRSRSGDNVEHTISAHFPNALAARHLDEIQIGRSVETHAEGGDEFRLCGGRSIHFVAPTGHQHQAICARDRRKQNQPDQHQAKEGHDLVILAAFILANKHPVF